MNDRRPAPRRPRPCDACPPAGGAPEPTPARGPAADAELARLCKAVGHPARVRILRALARRRTCVCGEIVAVLPLAQSTVSQHLKVLRQAGLVRGRVDGPRARACYGLDRDAVRRLRALVGTL